MFGFGRRKRKREEAAAAAKAAAEEAAKKLAEEAAAAETEETAEAATAESTDAQPTPTPAAESTATEEEPPETPSDATEHKEPIETTVDEPDAVETASAELTETQLAPVAQAEPTAAEKEAPETPHSEAPLEASSDTAEQEEITETAAESAVIEKAAPELPQDETTTPEPVEAIQKEVSAEAPSAEPATEEALTTPSEPIQEAPAEPAPESKPGFFKRLKKSLTRTRSNFADGLANLVLGHKEIDDELLEELETMLLVADVGVEATTRIINDLNGRVRRKELSDPSALSAALKTQLQDILRQCDKPVRQPSPNKPQVILMIGINGAGKTTTIGKLAKRLKEEGNSVMLAAGDTFRAAAVEQLQVWGERNSIPVIAQHTGADSASVIFDALQAATSRGVDVLIADTAGRLHTKGNLMDELAKIARVMQKIDSDAPHEVMLVVDATTGQNALNQALQFNETIPLTGITLTKLDGTAKGGILFAIADKMHIPIRFIGVGEAIEDLRYFDAKDFVNALFEE